MARKPNDNTVTYNIELSLTPEQVAIIGDKINDTSLSPGQKVAGYALAMLREIAAGGVLIDAYDRKRIRESTTVDITCADDLIPYLAEASGMEDGYHIVKLRIDPEYYSACGDIAQMRGVDVEQMVQEAVDNAQFNGWFEAIPEGRLSFVIMNGPVKASLEETLGGTFNTGSELLQLVQKAIGGSATDADDIHTDFFGDLGEEAEKEEVS